MTKFQTTITTAAIGCAAAVAGLLFIPSSAEARECTYGDSYKVCYEMTNRVGSMNRWDVTVTNQYTTEFMDITCDGKSLHTWESYGGATQSEVQTVAEAFCAL